MKHFLICVNICHIVRINTAVVINLPSTNDNADKDTKIMEILPWHCSMLVSGHKPPKNNSSDLLWILKEPVVTYTLLTCGTKSTYHSFSIAVWLFPKSDFNVGRLLTLNIPFKCIQLNSCHNSIFMNQSSMIYLLPFFFYIKHLQYMYI